VTRNVAPRRRLVALRGIARDPAKAAPLEIRTYPQVFDLQDARSWRLYLRSFAPDVNRMPQAKPAPPLLIQPVAPRRDHRVRGPHGEREDPYYWLRDDARKDPQVLSYLRAHNRFTAQWFKQHGGREKRLYREIIARLQQDDSSVPYFKNGHWYYARYVSGQEYPIYARRAGKLDAPEQVMLDVNQLAAGHAYFDIGAMEVSPDARLLAYCEDDVGRREYTLRVKDLESGTMLATSILKVENDIAWMNDGRSLLYVAKDPVTLLGKYVRRHRLGTDPAHDEPVFEQTDDTFYTTVVKSKSERFVFIGMENTVSSEWRYAEASDDALRFTTVLPAERDHEYQLEHWGGEFILRSNWQARNFRLVRAPLAQAGERSSWRDLQAHDEAVFIHDFEVLAHHVAISERSGGLRRLRVKTLEAATPAAAAVPREFFIEADEPAYTMSLGINPSLESDVLRYSYTSPKTPPSVFDYDLITHTRTLKKREPVLGSFDPDDYVTEFIRAPARDGAQIPVSLVYRKDTPLDGSAPLLQYGYGAYGHSLDPGFSSARLSLLDRGFVFALAHVRGGQELGRAWYDDGHRMKKQNSFTDFIDVTRALVAEHYAAKGRVAGFGRSAGGLLMGAVLNMAPEDYGAIITQVPFVDAVTTMLDPTVPLTTNEYDEWGNPEQKPAYDYILGYSPYDNITARPYPPVYVSTGLWDSQVQYYEPAKWVARLRRLKTDSNPLVFRVNMEAGHGGQSGRLRHYEEQAEYLAFMIHQLGVDTDTRLTRNAEAAK
jgi:oligopeptidase B